MSEWQRWWKEKPREGKVTQLLTKSMLNKVYGAAQYPVQVGTERNQKGHWFWLLHSIVQLWKIWKAAGPWTHGSKKAGSKLHLRLMISVKEWLPRSLLVTPTHMDQPQSNFRFQWVWRQGQAKPEWTKSKAKTHKRSLILFFFLGCSAICIQGYRV